MRFMPPAGIAVTKPEPCQENAASPDAATNLGDSRGSNSPTMSPTPTASTRRPSGEPEIENPLGLGCERHDTARRNNQRQLPKWLNTEIVPTELRPTGEYLLEASKNEELRKAQHNQKGHRTGSDSNPTVDSLRRRSESDRAMAGDPPSPRTASRIHRERRGHTWIDPI